MILLDAEDQQHQKLDSRVAGPTIRPPEQVAGRSEPSLPDYETSQAQAQSQTTAIFRKYSLHNTVDSRLCKAASYALIIYVALTITVGIPLLITRRGHKHLGPPDIVDSSSSLSTPLDYANAGFLALDDSQTCNVWDTFDDFSADASYTLDAKGSFSVRSTAWQESVDDSDLIYGNFTVDINPDPTASSAVFSVSISSSTSHFYKRSLICFSDKENDKELSIYIPSNLTESDNLSLDVTLLFPQKPSLSLTKLVTYLPMFSQRVGALAPQIGFDLVELEGAGMDIHVDSLKARQITVKNSLAAIIGTYNVSSSLKLDTVGGPILTDITLVQDETSKAPTFFALDTGNSEINAQVLLLADPSEFALHPIMYMGHVRNFNGPVLLDISYDSSTPTAPIDLLVQNNQAESNITLDDKFVGVFDLSTKLAAASIDWDGAVDPSGQSRKRTLVYDETSSSSRRKGWTGYGTRPERWDPHEEGKVAVMSSLSPIFLQVGSGLS